MEKSFRICYNVYIYVLRGEIMKTRGLLSLILCAVLLAALFSSCSKNEAKAFYFAVEAPAGTFDPTIVSDTTAGIIVRSCFEGLVCADEYGSVTPGAAVNWTVSPDGLTYTFELRPDACWHITSNAQEELEGKLPENFDLSLTADDFVFAFRRAVDPAMGAPDAYKLSSIAGAQEIMRGEVSPAALGVEALSAHELKITLTRAQEDFLYVLTEPLCMPCNETFFNASGGRYGLFIKDSLTNGPFYLSYFDDGVYRITKNPDYHGDHTPKADVIRFYVCSDKETLYSELKDDEYSGALLSESDLASFTPGKKTELLSSADVTRAFLLNAKSETLSDVWVRTAFMLATDVENFASVYGEKKAYYSPAPSVVKNAADYAFSPEYAPEKAVKLLSSALEKSEKTSVTISLKCEERFELMLKKQLQDWQKIFGTSFNINVEPLSADELEKAVRSGDYEAAFYPVRAESFSASDFFSRFLSASPNNVFGIEDTAADTAVSGGDAKSISAALYENAVILPVWEENTYFFCAENVTGIKLLPGTDCIYFYDCDNVSK